MSEERGRIAPHSPEAEEGLLGSCLIDTGQDILSACMEAGLKPESFFKPAHKVIFQVIQDLYVVGKESDWHEDRVPHISRPPRLVQHVANIWLEPWLLGRAASALIHKPPRFSAESIRHQSTRFLQLPDIR